MGRSRERCLEGPSYYYYYYYYYFFFFFLHFFFLAEAALLPFFFFFFLHFFFFAAGEGAGAPHVGLAPIAATSASVSTPLNTRMQEAAPARCPRRGRCVVVLEEPKGVSDDPFSLEDGDHSGPFT